MLIIRSLIVLICLALPVQALTGVARVVDGDTLALRGQNIRLFGMDAPEKAQRCDVSGRNWACGVWATQKLRDIVGTGRLNCRQVDTDRHQRPVAVCHINGRDIAAEMVRAGAAVAYIKYSADYAGHEAEAKREKRGIWAGSVTSPEAFRQAARSQPAPTACLIKGNIGAKGLRIYHLPGQRDYGVTRISPSKGEAFFCYEAEAQAAGFRKAHR